MALSTDTNPKNVTFWIFLILRKSNFSQKTENVRFLRKMQKTQGNNEIVLQKLVKYTHKSSKFGGKPAQKIIWRFGTWRSPGTNLQKPTFPEISCFFGNRKIIRNLSFSRQIPEIPTDYSDYNNELSDHKSSDSASIIQGISIFTIQIHNFNKHTELQRSSFNNLT